jgi:hypothetical protein
MNYSKITNEQWGILTEKSKLVAIQSILTSWKLNGKRIKYDSKWFLEAIEQSIVDTDGTKLEERMKILAKMGNAFGERDELIKELSSQLTKEDKERYLYVNNKIKEYKQTQKKEFISDKIFDNIINNCANNFNISSKEMLSSWDKADKAHWGVEL